MTKIEELIKKLCPNGVKYYMLGDLEDENILKFLADEKNKLS